MNVGQVQIVCAACGAARASGIQLLEDGRKVRICRKCKGVLDNEPPEERYVTDLVRLTKDSGPRN